MKERNNIFQIPVVESKKGIIRKISFQLKTKSLVSNMHMHFNATDQKGSKLQKGTKSRQKICLVTKVQAYLFEDTDKLIKAYVLQLHLINCL